MQCPNCNKQVEVFSTIANRTNQFCKMCGFKLVVQITNYHNQDWFKPHYNEHFTGEPILIRTKKHLKELCLKHNVTSRALGDVRNVTEI